MDKLQALHSFWSDFGLKAYDENSVPDEALKDLKNDSIPYLTYEATNDDFGNPIAQTINLWYRSSSWTNITAKEQEISSFITRGGRMIAYDDGAMWIQKGAPWAQRLSDTSDDMIRRIALNVTVEFMD